MMVCCCSYNGGRREPLPLCPLHDDEERGVTNEKGFVVVERKPGTPKDTAAPSGRATVRRSGHAAYLRMCVGVDGHEKMGDEK